MIKPLTSLRFVFALMVFFSHCIMIDPHFGQFFYQEGFIGVSFFFVLSGFIIAYNYQDKLITKEKTKKQFWIARFARIYPLHILTLLLVALFGGYIFEDATDWLKHFIPNLFLLQAFIPFESYYFSFNSPSWSLGCEQFFYLAFPFLVWVFSKRFKLLCLTILFFIIIIPLGMYYSDPQIQKAFWYVNPMARIADFLIGMFLYNLYYKTKQKGWSYGKASFFETFSIIFFILFLLGANAGVAEVYRNSFYYWLPISVIILVFARQSGIFSRILSNKPMVLLGEISFGAYMFHFFIIKAYVHLTDKLDLNIPFQIAVIFVLIFVIALSLVSYRFFEKPTNKLIKRCFK